jgi:hypothetical protein
MGSGYSGYSGYTVVTGVSGVSGMSGTSQQCLLSIEEFDESVEVRLTAWGSTCACLSAA